MKANITYENACKGKRRYTKQKAKEDAARLSGETGEPYEAYPCPFCGHYHIGHKIAASRHDRIRRRKRDRRPRREVVFNAARSAQERPEAFLQDEKVF